MDNHSNCHVLLTACNTEVISCCKPTTFHNAEIMHPARILLVPKPDPLGKSDHDCNTKPPLYFFIRFSARSSFLFSNDKIFVQKKAAFRRAPENKHHQLTRNIFSLAYSFTRIKFRGSY